MKRTIRTRHRSRAARSSGFSLLELIVVVSILAILAGAAVPVARRAIDHAARRATLAELEVLAAASAELFEDTWTLPLDLRALTSDPGLRGWTGPYLRTTGKDLRTGAAGVEVDGWSFAYRVERIGPSTLEITSPGPDGEHGLLDDYTIRVDVTPIRRERTLARLRALNLAIEHYNRTWLATDPLPADFAGLLGKLVTRGFLPAAKPWAEDGWGEPFVTDPPAATPVLRVTSATLSR